MIFAQEQVLDKRILQQFQAMAAFLAECGQRHKRLDEVERGLWSQLMELGRALLQHWVATVGPGDVGPTFEHQGQRLQRSAQRQPKVYRSLFGMLRIYRYVYARAQRQRVVAPLDKRLGLPQGEQSYVLEDWIGRLTARMSYGESVALLRELGIATSVRAAEMVTTKLAEHAADFGHEPQPVEETPSPPAEPAAIAAEEEVLAVSADAKGVPMRRSLEQRLQEEHGRRPHRRSRMTTYEPAQTRRLRNTAAGRKQMAYVGVVYDISVWRRNPAALLEERRQRRPTSTTRPVPQNKRYWAEMTHVLPTEVAPGSKRLFQALRQEVLARDPHHTRSWVCLMDGQVSLWNLKQQYLPEAVGILDVYHVTEKLWQAAYDFHPEASAAAEQFVERYLEMLLEGKVGYVTGVFRRFLKQRQRHKLKKKGLQEAIRYFATNRQAMRYHDYLAAGYPIGSGVVEGACRHVVKDRMERTGMRWNIEGAQAILDLRTTLLNKGWSAFMEHRIRVEQRKLYGQAA